MNRPVNFLEFAFSPIARIGALSWIALLCATGAFSQSGGTIAGTVVDSDGQAVANAKVQAANRSTKTVYKTAGSEQGHYTLAALPPGAYDVSIDAPGFYPKNQQNVSVGATEPLRLDVRLLEFQLGTLGDGREFRVQLTSPHPAPAGPTPRTADGKPDLSGVWFAQRTVDAGKPEPLPWAEALLRERGANNGKDAPGARCREASPTRGHCFLTNWFKRPTCW